MGQRRILVIGSQCEALNPLTDLDRTAEEFLRAMLDPEKGRCVPALESGIVLNPTVADTKQKIRAAYQSCSADGATLFLAYIGHGACLGEHLYLLPSDAEKEPDMDTGVLLLDVIREEYQRGLTRNNRLDGLVVLLDVCYAGAGLSGVTAEWENQRRGDFLRFELLTATRDYPAYRLCFTKSITSLLNSGSNAIPKPRLQAGDCVAVLKRTCQQQMPDRVSRGEDEGLWLMLNQTAVSTTAPWMFADSADEIIRLTSFYRPPAVLARITDLMHGGGAVAILATAGAGKSALVAALARPDATRGVVPPGCLNAVVFLTASSTPEEVAAILARQLCRSVPGFTASRDLFRTRTQHTPEWNRLDALHREVVGPLRLLKPARPVRIALDAVDQLPGSSVSALDELVRQVSTDADLGWVRVFLTARPDTPLPAGVVPWELERTPDSDLSEYLHERGVPAKRIEAAVRRADGNWLVAEKLADLCERDPTAFDPSVIPRGLGGVYDAALLKAGADDPRRWQEALGPVLTVLAAAGAGPVLPFSLFRRACQELRGPDDHSRLRDVLVELRGFVVRAEPGGEDERVGLFHQTLCDHLHQPGRRTSVEVSGGHHALLVAIEELAPLHRWNPNETDANQRYAFLRHAEHLWAVGRYADVVPCLAGRTPHIPRENRNVWLAWLARFSTTLSPDDPDTLTTRSNVAGWTGETGEAREALRLFRELLPDRQRVLGPDHPTTLTTRSNVAGWTGETGEAREALRLFRELLPDRQRVLGPDHPATLTTRSNVAAWTGETGEAREALRLFRELLPDQQRVLGPDHPATLTTRNNVAALTGRTGEAREALRLFRELLPDQQRVLGPDHPTTLTTRNNVAHWTGETGEAREALRLFRELLPDRQRVLGPDHPTTLTTRNNVAHWTGDTGEAREALRLFRELLPDQQRVLGPDHPTTLTTRNNVAHWTGDTGEAREALRLFRELLPDQQRVLGPDHPDTLTTRSNVAHWTGETGEAREALRLFRELLPDRQRVLGPDHPTTLTTRSNVAGWTGDTGEAREALRLFRELLPDQQRVLGPDHPDTQAVVRDIADLERISPET